MAILKQAEQWPTTMEWRNQGGLQIAHGPTHSYLIDPPTSYGPTDAAGRTRFGRPDQHLLFTFPHGAHEKAWDFHSPHDSLGEATAAAEAHSNG